MEQKANNFKALQLLHKAMLTGMILFFLVSVVLVVMRQTTFVNASTGKILQVSVALAAFLSAGAGYFIFNKRLQSITTMATATERINTYRLAAIIRWGLIELPVLFAIISFVLTGNYAFPALAIVLMILFAATAPLKNKVIQQLQLKDEEVMQLEG
jgi:hypothetical protein